MRPDGERTTVPSPVEEAADGAIEMRSAIIEATGYKNFIGAVLLFPDMERDKRIESAARRTSCVHTVWGLDGLVESLERVLELAEFHWPPLSRISENEWELLHELQYARPPAPDCQGQKPVPPEGIASTPGRSSSSTSRTSTSTRRRWRESRMDRQEHIGFGRLLELMEFWIHGNPTCTMQGVAECRTPEEIRRGNARRRRRIRRLDECEG